MQKTIQAQQAYINSLENSQKKQKPKADKSLSDAIFHSTIETLDKMGEINKNCQEQLASMIHDDH